MNRAKRIFVQHWLMLIVDILISFILLPTFIPFADSDGHSISIKNAFLIILYYLILLSIINIFNCLNMKKFIKNVSFFSYYFKLLHYLNFSFEIITLFLLGFEIWNWLLWILLSLDFIIIISTIIFDIYNSSYYPNIKTFSLTIINQILFVTILDTIFLTFPG